MNKADSVVIIPTYNEKENIENIIRYVFSLEKEFHILIVEDNSPDGTADIVKRLIEEFPKGFLSSREKANSAWGRLTFMVSNGLCKEAMTLSLKWMPTFRTLQKTF